MISTSFSFHAPESADEAVELLARDDGPTELIGGGTWVVTEMSHGKRRPARVIDLGRAGLGGVRVAGDGLVIGATTTYTDLLESPLVGERLPLLRTLALGITGGAQIWNRGTVGGSACYANPASDMPAALVALEATLRLRSVDGVRDCAAAEFFQGAFSADVRDGEILTEISVGPCTDSGYVKFKLSESSWPIVTAAYVAGPGDARVVLGGAQAAPLRIDLTAGTAGLAERVEEAVTEPWSDVLADGDYRRAIAGVIAERAVAQAQDQIDWSKT